MDYVIVMDASGDVDESYEPNREAQFLPMEYTLGSETHMCRSSETRENLRIFYSSLRENVLTQTTQISPYLYETYLYPYFEKGLSVIYLCLSGGLSSSFQSALVAKQSLEEKYPGLQLLPVDTHAASGGIGVIMERAMRNQKAGMNLEDNYRDLVEASSKIRHWFLVQDLMYLKRGGRVSAATAVVGTALNIKPVLIIDREGKLETVAKKRGNKLAVNYILEQFKETYDPDSGDAVYIIDADNDEMSAYLTEGVKKLFPDAEIRHHGLSPIIGAHTGPDMAAICHMGK